MPSQLTGIENLMICLEILQDLGAQLLGDPASAIAAIRRSGQLAAAPRFAPAGASFEEREALAGAKIATVHRRKAQRDAVEAAIAVIQETVRGLSKSNSVPRRLPAGS